MFVPKAGDLLTILQLAVALNFTYSGVSYFADSEISRARVYLQDLKSLFNSETDERKKMAYGSALLKAYASYSSIQGIDRITRPANLILVFTILGFLSFALLIVATLMAQEVAPTALIAFSMVLAIIPTASFVAILTYSLSVVKNVQATLFHASKIRASGNQGPLIG